MNRFREEKKERSLIRKFFWPLFFFVLLLAVFFLGLRSVSSTTSEEEKKALEDSITRSVVHCYAVEGRYPESLSYLEEHYGVTYDHSRFVVDYEVFASNLMPQVTVISLSNKEGQS